ncbi:insulinase family protein [bacterium]|nr:insulinase family protein [bacterium]
MKKLLYVIIISILWGSPFARALDETVARLEQKPVPSFEAPDVPTYTFPNGLQLFYYPNRELPVFEAQLLINVGAIHEDPQKLGLLTLLTSSIRIGGTSSYTPNQVDEELEKIASDIDVGASRESTVFKMSCLTKDVDQTLKIFFEMLKTPRLDAERVELVRTQMLDAITHRNEEPESITDREFAQMLYGDKSEWVRIYNETTAKNISVDDMKAFIANYFTPGNMRIAVSSQLTMEEVIEKLKPFMEGFNAAGKTKPFVAPVQKTWGKKLEIIDLPVNQSNIMMGHFGEKRFNPDKYALILGNYVLGGSTFGSRLGSRIRTTLGLAYSIYSQFEFDTDYGTFAISTSTKTGSTTQLIEESKATIHDILEKNPITDAEINFARQSILNQLVFQLDDPYKIAVTDMQYDFYAYPKKYLNIYQKGILGVTSDDVARVLKQYVRPDDFEILIVGNKKEIVGLDKLGEVVSRPLDDQ